MPRKEKEVDGGIMRTVAEGDVVECAVTLRPVILPRSARRYYVDIYLRS